MKLNKLNNVIDNDELVELWYKNRIIFTGCFSEIPIKLKNYNCKSITVNCEILSIEMVGVL